MNGLPQLIAPWWDPHMIPSLLNSFLNFTVYHPVVCPVTFFFFSKLMLIQCPAALWLYAGYTVFRMLFLMKQGNKFVWNDIFTQKTGHLTLFLHLMFYCTITFCFTPFIALVGFLNFCLCSWYNWIHWYLTPTLAQSVHSSYRVTNYNERIIPTCCRILQSVMLPFKILLLMDLRPSMKSFSCACQPHLHLSNSSTKYQYIMS